MREQDMELTETYPGSKVHEAADGRAAIASFAAFYASSRNTVYRSVLVTVRDPHRAEDAVQEAFARAYADWDRVRQHPNPIGWVARVALNQATSLWRRLRRETAEPPPDSIAAADERPIDAALVRLVWQLPRRQRQVVAIRILLDQSTEQTATLLGIAPGTVTAHLHRALHSLRYQLTDAGHAEEHLDHG
ncbi:MAG: sigma-70 family RNA polymerase sigma factor [Candidatus Limnocylindrales bacterium]